jgi:GH15 family glucan-1,4-alpha-glucosidase
MALPLEDYGLIGDCHTAALVGRDGSIPWWCPSRFDSEACFAALLGDQRHGHWVLRPTGHVLRTNRRYREGTLVLETEVQTVEGTVRVVEFMPPRQRENCCHVVRMVEGLQGCVPMRMQLIARFAYGSVVPRLRQVDGALVAVAGADALELRTPVDARVKNGSVLAQFKVSEGERIPFTLGWHPSHEGALAPLDASMAEREVESWWRRWSSQCSYEGEWREEVLNSLVILKAMTYAPTGAIAAAPTTSLPEQLGGVRNWDYRLSWPRDDALAVGAFLGAGYQSEARTWRDWLLRAAAGNPSALQAVYGLAGERHLPEREIPWLPGYERSSPVRVGNAAARQFQLDVYGEVCDVFHQARVAGLEADRDCWELERALIHEVESAWLAPDEGIWEVRGPRRQFTHSKVMAWVAVDRAVKAVELYGLAGPARRWRRLRQQIHDEVCKRGYDSARNTFTQSFGSEEVDASLLRMPMVGFLPADDERIVGTVEAIAQRLSRDGLVWRYAPDVTEHIDGLPPGEGAFVPCSYWLAEALSLVGRHDDAISLFERLLSLRNDLGLLAEQYDPRSKRQVGNYPQVLSHLALVSTALRLSRSTHGSTGK